MRPIWGRGLAGTLAALQDRAACLPFALLGLDSDKGGEFLNGNSWSLKIRRPGGNMPT